jgi:hypothetical protein
MTAACRFGMVERAREHFMLAGQVNQSDPAEFQRLQEVERHLGRCMDARKTGDWKSALREADAAIANGADSSQLVISPSSLYLCCPVGIVVLWPVLKLSQ